MKSMSPNDFGTEQIADVSDKISINQIIRTVNTQLRKTIVQSRVNALGWDIELTTSRTGFGGKRLWFKCPICRKRCGVLYKKTTNNTIGCRACVGVKYRKSRYKGMLEEKLA